MRAVTIIFFILLSSFEIFGALTNPPTATEKQYLKYTNQLSNGGFEGGIVGWSSGITLSSTAGQFKEGNRGGVWDASGASTIQSPAWTTKQDTAVNALGQCWIKTADADYDLQIYDGSSVVAEVDVPASSDLFVPVSVSFVAAESTTYRIRLEAQGNEDVAYIDDCYLGENFLLGQVSQASFVGSAYYATTANCTWSRTNTALGAFGTDADCPVPTIESNPGPGTIQTTDADLPQITINNLPPGIYMVIAEGTTSPSSGTIGISLALSDGTTTSGISSCAATAGTNGCNNAVVGMFTYSATGNRTFALHGSASANAIQLTNESANRRVYFKIYRYPTQSELVLTPNLTGWFVDANITGANPSLGTSAQSAYVGITNGSLTMSKNTGSADVQIGCSTTNAPTGLTCSSGDESVSVSFLPPSAGMYIACASFGHRINTGASGLVNATFQVVETATNAQTILQEGNSKTPSHSFSNFDLAHPVRICGSFNFNDNSRKMIRLMYEQTVNATISNNELLADAAANNGQRNIRWEVYPISRMSQVNVMNQVSTDTVTGDRECWVQFGGASEVSACTSNPCTIYRGSGCVSSVTWNSTGNYTLNFATGKFSAAPVCIAQAIAAGTQRLVLPQSRSTTSYNVIFRTLADANVDISGQVSCIGPK